MRVERSGRGVRFLAVLLAFLAVACVALVCAPRPAQAASNPPYVDWDPSAPYIEGLFSDVQPGAWYYDYVNFVYGAGLMTGYDSGIFAPEDTVTRAMAATVLYRLATGDAGVGGQVTHFYDVPTGQWYTKAIEWCYQSGVVTGYQDGDSFTGEFGPNDPVTREQLCTMLYRLGTYLGAPGGTSTSVIYNFTDGYAVSGFAQTGTAWCISYGIVSGDYAWNPPHINPQGNATRAQMAKMLMVLCLDVF